MSAKPSYNNFQEYLIYPTDPEDWRKIEEEFRNRLNVPHTVGALDAQIFNHSQQRRRIENETLGLQQPEPHGPGDQIYTASFWGMIPLSIWLGWSIPTEVDK